MHGKDENAHILVIKFWKEEVSWKTKAGLNLQLWGPWQIKNVETPINNNKFRLW